MLLIAMMGRMGPNISSCMVESPGVTSVIRVGLIFSFCSSASPPKTTFPRVERISDIRRLCVHMCECECKCACVHVCVCICMRAMVNCMAVCCRDWVDHYYTSQYHHQAYHSTQSPGLSFHPIPRLIIPPSPQAHHSTQYPGSSFHPVPRLIIPPSTQAHHSTQSPGSSFHPVPRLIIPPSTQTYSKCLLLMIFP